MNREIFSSVFEEGDEINSGGPPERANAARLRILSIEERGVRYKSIKSKNSRLLPYSTLDIVLAGFDRIDPNAIQRTIQPVYLDAGLKRNEFTENYEYGFAREFRRRQERFASRRERDCIRSSNPKSGPTEATFAAENAGPDITGLIRGIAELQQLAIKIKPSSETGLLPARGGLAGPAFFPEGLGLCESVLRGGAAPTVMAIGHNFGCSKYRDEIQVPSREDDKATWRNLDRLLLQAGSQPEFCFRTNWFVGLLPGNVQTGKFLKRPDSHYEDACNRLLIEQIKLIRPKLILILGPEVAGRAYQVFPKLIAWRHAKSWIDIDRSNIGYSPRNIEVPAAGVSTNIAAILHPSFGAANQSRRMNNMLQPTSESEIIRAALA
jgi:hypothetical protein